jgi:hypothetical protein
VPTNIEIPSSIHLALFTPNKYASLVMSETEKKTGEKALRGDWERIGAFVFELQEDMTMEFDGKSCNILDSKRAVVEIIPQGKETRDVLAGYRCYVMEADIRFTKKSP